ncbi:MAG TPA: ABC transporter substrate binding protein [Dissulfurispiraceae bacterium]|nr:ABC transporter substrate binding protein [Dissulfurispiraceae bacterium]
MVHGISGKSRSLFILCLALMLMVFISMASAAEQKNVLVLNAYHDGYQWTNDITRGILSVLDLNKVKVYIDYLDTKRNPGEPYQRGLDDFYKTKFKGVNFDAIVVSDDDALGFMRRNRDRLFPNVPVIFTGINWFAPEKLGGLKGVTGVNEDADVQATLDLMISLHPGAKKIYVVNDTTTTGKVVHDKFNQIMPKYQGKVEFIWLEDIEMSKILETVSKLGADSLVLMTVFQKDKAGNFFEFSESTKMVSDASKVPMYGLWDFNLKHGIVGGMLTSGFYQGKAAGDMLNRVLRGTSPDAIPVLMESPNKYMFDYVQIDRFKIDRAKLPPGSTVLNQPGANVSVSKTFVWGIGFLMVLLSMGAAFLIYKRL